MPARLAAVVNVAAEAALDRRPPAGGLSPRERIALLADLELNVRWTAQAARILREPTPILAAVERDIRVLEHAYRNQDVRVALGAYTMARRHLLGQLGRLGAAGWGRTARTVDGRILTLAAWAACLAHEDEDHLAEIEARLAGAP